MTMRDAAIAASGDVPYKVSAYITHTLNNQLQSIMGACECIQRNNGSTMDTHLAATAMQSAKVIRDMVDDLFPALRLKAGA